jgi:hypothetical protein
MRFGRDWAKRATPQNVLATVTPQQIREIRVTGVELLDRECAAYPKLRPQIVGEN